MKTHPSTLIIAAACAILATSCASPPTPTRIPVSAPLRPNASVSEKLFKEINDYRRSVGARELQRHAGLDRLAQEHCEYLRAHRGTFSLNGKNVSHIGFDGRALIARERYQMEGVSENVAAAKYPGQSPTAVIITLWKNSKDHHENMIDSWTHSGIGVVEDSDGMYFATQIFSTVSSAPMSNRERFSRF